MKYHGHSQLLVYALSALSALTCLVVVVYHWAAASNTTRFDSITVPPTSNFQFKDELVCEIVISTRDRENSILLPFLAYSSFRLEGLVTDNPELVPIGSSALAHAFVKSDESGGGIILQMDPVAFGWTDTISLMKDTGSFVRVITGIQAGNWQFHYAIAQKGRCK